jgi:hypothetical protein
MPGFEKVGEHWYTADPPLPILVKLLFTSDKLSCRFIRMASAVSARPRCGIF